MLPASQGLTGNHGPLGVFYDSYIIDFLRSTVNPSVNHPEHKIGGLPQWEGHMHELG